MTAKELMAALLNGHTIKHRIEGTEIRMDSKTSKLISTHCSNVAIPAYPENWYIESPNKHIKLNDPVVVWNDKNQNNPATPDSVIIKHFARIDKNGRARTFSDGRTSFTETETTSWDHCVPLSEWAGVTPWNDHSEWIARTGWVDPDDEERQ